MDKGFDKFSIREILIIVLPGFYASALSTPLLNNFLELKGVNELIQTTIFIIVSLTIGITLYFIDFPKRVFFFKNSMPSKILHRELPNIDNIELDVAFYSFYDSNISEVEKSRTNVYTSLYHFTVNIFLVSFILSILFAVFEADYFKSYGLITGTICLLSAINTVGIFFGKQKINYMFKRQLVNFRLSSEYLKLKAKNKLPPSQ